jgi:hypothetical protein
MLETSVSDRIATLMLPFNKNIQSGPVSLNVTLWIGVSKYGVV